MVDGKSLSLIAQNIMNSGITVFNFRFGYIKNHIEIVSYLKDVEHLFENIDILLKRGGLFVFGYFLPGLNSLIIDKFLHNERSFWSAIWLVNSLNIEKINALRIKAL